MPHSLRFLSSIALLTLASITGQSAMAQARTAVARPASAVTLPAVPNALARPRDPVPVQLAGDMRSGSGIAAMQLQSVGSKWSTETDLVTAVMKSMSDHQKKVADKINGSDGSGGSSRAGAGQTVPSTSTLPCKVCGPAPLKK